MRILLLSCNTGEGHNSAAYAIAKVLQQRDIEYELVDPVVFSSEKAKNVVSASYNNMIKKAPAAFGVLYKIGAIYSATNITSPIYLANSTYATNLDGFIRERKFDAVISTHLFGMEAMTALRRKSINNIPSFGVLTDYVIIPFLQETRLTRYFVPHADLANELSNKNIDRNLICASGIPVDPKFSQRAKKSDARSSLGIPQDKKVILVMTGGIGCGNINGICDSLIENSPDDFIAYVLVGRNSIMKDKLNSRYADCKQISPVAFTKQVNLYMNAADVMISKAGGLSSTEAAVANVPLVHTLVYSANESKNVAFFTSRGMSVAANNNEETVRLAWGLILDKDKAKHMIEMQQKHINPFAAETVVERSIGL